MKNIVQSLWIGNELSPLEISTINSHVENGHEFHLYVYNEVRNIPLSAVVKDGREILPEREIFCYQVGAGKGSFSSFSNCFRYKLLADRGNWWVDLDVICLKEFNFDKEYVIASEKNLGKGYKAATCVMKAPAKLMELCFRKSMLVNRETLRWAEIGPNLLERSINKLNMREYVVPSYVFCPVHWFNSDDLFSNKEVDVSKSYAVHIWNEIMRRSGRNKFVSYDANCLYQKLVERFRNNTRSLRAI